MGLQNKQLDQSILAAHCENFNGTRELYDMFQSLDDNVFEETPANVLVKKLSVDLEQLDLKNITNKLNSVRKSLNTTNFQKTVLNEFETRRIGKQGDKYSRRDATTYLEKTKILDLMLQTIYMARYNVKHLENEPYFNSKDTSYRIAFLYRRVRRLWKRLHDICMTMSAKLQREFSRNYNPKKKYQRVNHFLNLHYKAAKLHIDFMYTWWIIIKLQEKYNSLTNVPNTFPPDKDED